MSISPNIPSPEESYRYESTGTPRWIAVLFVVLIAALAVFGYFGYSTESKLSQDLSKQQDQNKILTAQLDQANTRIADLKSKVEITVQRVGLTQSELAQAKSRAEAIRKEQQASDLKLTTQLTQAQKENDEKIGAVATEVGGAKKDTEGWECGRSRGCRSGGSPGQAVDQLLFESPSIEALFRVLETLGGTGLLPFWASR